jgi:hypothetical protein
MHNPLHRQEVGGGSLSHGRPFGALCYQQVGGGLQSHGRLHGALCYQEVGGGFLRHASGLVPLYEL